MIINAVKLQRLISPDGKTKMEVTLKTFIPGGYSWELLVGVCNLVLQILTLFQTKKCHFPHPFSDLAFRQKLFNYLD